MHRLRHPAAHGRRDPITGALVLAVLALLTIGGTGTPPASDAAPPPAGRFAHGAAGTARNGFGGEVAPSPTIESWPGTGAGRNGGAFAFIGAQYGSLWSIPPSSNNSMGVGYCVMEDVGGEGTVALQPDPAVWDAGEMARAAALMATFGGDRVAPYGIDASGAYDLASGEWQQPSLFGGGEYTRRRHVAVGFGVKMMVDDVSPSGVIAGRKLARDTAIVNGSGGEFSALRNGYEMAQRMAAVADIQHAVGGVRLEMLWDTPGGAAPTDAGTYHLDVRATDSAGKPVGLVPVVQLSDIGIGTDRSVGAVATVNRTGDTADDLARWNAAELTGWPTFDMAGSMAVDARFALAANPQSADITDAAGVARFDVTIPGPDWELAFHTQAPTANVDLYSGTGVQGQITWSGPPQSASVHQAIAAPVTGRFVVRKMLDASDVQGARDMSGFVFTVESAGSTIATVATLADGRTPAISAGAGDYRITEVGRPEWATGLLDHGPLDVRFDPTGPVPPDTIEAEFVYTNNVPTASITTRASDAADGDKFIDHQTGRTDHDARHDAGHDRRHRQLPGARTGHRVHRPWRTRHPRRRMRIVVPAGHRRDGVRPRLPRRFGRGAPRADRRPGRCDGSRRGGRGVRTDRGGERSGRRRAHRPRRPRPDRLLPGADLEPATRRQHGGRCGALRRSCERRDLPDGDDPPRTPRRR